MNPASPPDRSAFSDALRRIARRPRTRREVEEHLRRAGYPVAEIDTAVERLVRDRYLDDLELGLHYVATRAVRKGHGRARLVRELEGRGVEPETAREAWRRAVESGEVDPEAILRREVEKRVPRSAGRLDRRSYTRVYNALLRLGHEPGTIREALASRAADPGEIDEDTSDHDLKRNT
jgi:regulatory protein